MINWSRVQELKTEFGAEAFDELLELFICEVEETLETLPGAAGDPRTLQERLHFLKGSALNLGMTDFAECCHVGEKAAAGGAVDPTVALAPGIFEASKSDLIRGLRR